MPHVSHALGLLFYGVGVSNLLYGPLHAWLSCSRQRKGRENKRATERTRQTERETEGGRWRQRRTNLIMNGGCRGRIILDLMDSPQPSTPPIKRTPPTQPSLKRCASIHPQPQTTPPHPTPENSPSPHLHPLGTSHPCGWQLLPGSRPEAAGRDAPETQGRAADGKGACKAAVQIQGLCWAVTTEGGWRVDGRWMVGGW